jgi:hypothetical protein
VWLAPISVGAKVADLTGEQYLRAIIVITAINGASFCIPGNATPQDVLKATFAFMQARPDQKQYLFADVMLAAVLDHWPCRAK